MKLHTPLIHKAMQFAYDAHHVACPPWYYRFNPFVLLKKCGICLYNIKPKQKLDKGGIPYIFHPAFLASQMDSEEEIIAALLHDVIEKTSKTLVDLEEAGFPPSIIEAVGLLTHNKQDDEFMDYVQRLRHNPLARKVKLADLRHNCDPMRSEGLSPENIQKKRDAMQLLEKYDAETHD
jgi:(p)ppGpp synthase/HD superfamily hydrolase